MDKTAAVVIQRAWRKRVAGALREAHGGETKSVCVEAADHTGDEPLTPAALRLEGIAEEEEEEECWPTPQQGGLSGGSATSRRRSMTPFMQSGGSSFSSCKSGRSYLSSCTDYSAVSDDSVEASTPHRVVPKRLYNGSPGLTQQQQLQHIQDEQRNFNAKDAPEVIEIEEKTAKMSKRKGELTEYHSEFEEDLLRAQRKLGRLQVGQAVKNEMATAEAVRISTARAAAVARGVKETKAAIKQTARDHKDTKHMIKAIKERG
jgi:hypothetical protein